MSKWRGARGRRDIQHAAAERTHEGRDAGDARRGEWTREDLVTLESGSAGPMVLALERGSRGGVRLLIEHHRANGLPAISMRIPGHALAMVSAVIAMITEREP